MKTFCLGAILALLCFQNYVTAQTSRRPYSGNVPKAGQTLPDGMDLFQTTLYDRVIDFDSLGMAWEGNWPAGQSFSISASPTGDTLFVGEGGMLDVLDISDPYNPVMVAGIRARVIIDPTSATLAGSTSVVLVLANSPNWAMYCSATLN